MYVELYCDHCERPFVASPDTPASEVVDRLSEEGPWSALGDGVTVEDALAAALSDGAAGRCPRCGTEATVSEESLGRVTMELLATW